MKIKSILLSSVLTLASFVSNAQSFSMTGAGGTYLQDFNTLNTAGSVAWADNTNILNIYAQRTGTGTTVVADAGSGTGGNLYSYGSVAAADRALGSLGSGNAAAGSFAYGVQLQNNTGSTITTMTVSYTGEQWRNSAVATAQTITLWYKVSATPITTLNPNASAANGWTQITGIDFSSPINGGVAGALDGNAAANRLALSGTISGLSIPVGEHIMIKWDDPDHTGTDHGLSIDDVSITWGTIAPCTPPATQVTSFTSGTLSNITADISWTVGSGTNSIVLISANNPVSANPSNGIAYSANAAYAAGSQIGTGNYVVYNGTGNSLTVSGLTASTTYYFSIYTFDPNGGSPCYNTVSPATGNVTTTAAGVGTALQIQSILVDACAYTSNEPLSEMVRFKNGTLSLDIANISIAGGSNGVYQNNKWPNAAQAWHGLSQNATTASITAQFDATISPDRCGVLLEPPAGIIPPGATVIMVCSQRPAVALNDFSNLNDTVYMVYQTTVTDTSQGHFVNYNSVSGLRHLVIKDNQNGFRDTVTYDRSLLVTPAGTPGQADGATVLFDDPGNATYINYNCSAPYVPFFIDAGANTATCFNAPVSLTASTSIQFSSITWSGGAGSFSAPNSTTTNYTPGITETSGSFYVYATLQSYCSTFVKDSVLITINPAPTPTVTSNIASATVCSGSPITLTASGGTSYLWNTTATTSTITVNPTTSTEYTVDVTNACSTTQATFSVTVNALPVIVAGNTGAYCVKDSVQLSATVGYTYNWTGPNSFTSTSQNPSIPNSTVANAGTYSLTVTDANTCQNNTTTNVIINALPTFNASAIVNTPANCGSTDGGIAGVGVNGTNGTNYNYDWIAPDSTILVTSPDSVLANVGGGIYYLAATEIATGCRDSVSFTINTLGGPLQPTFTLTTVTSVCEGSNYTLTIDPASATAGATYNWTIPGAVPQSGVDLTSITINGITIANQGVYGVEVVGVGCNNTGSISITVNPLPNPMITGTTHFCTGQNTVLSASSLNTSGNSFQWLLNGSPIGGATATTYTATQAGDYEVIATATTTCYDTSATTSVTVDSLPVITTVVTTSAGCGMNNGAITGTTVSGTATITYQWTDGAGNILGTNADISNLGIGQYTFIATDGNGCVDSTFYTITAPNAPNAPTFAAQPNVCEGGTFSLTVTNPSAGATYTWSANGVSTQSGVNLTSITITDANAVNVGIYNVVVSVDACKDSATTSAIFHPRPDPQITSTSTGFCAGSSLPLTASPASGVTYQWYLNNNPITNATTGIYTATQAGNYQLYVNDGTCDSISFNYPIIENPLPIVNTTALPVVITPAGCSMTNGSIIGASATGAFPITYQWLNNVGTILSPNAVLTNIGAGTYYLIATDNNGCIDSDSATVTAAAAPSPLTFNAAPNVCAGSTFSLSVNPASVTNGATYTWTATGVSTQSGLNLSSITVTNANIQNVGIYTVTVNVDACVETATVSATFNALPNPQITSTSTGFCAGSSLPLVASPASGVTYQWYLNNNPITNATTGTYTATQAGNYQLYVNDGTCDSISQNYPITINPLPLVFVNNPTVCTNTSATLIAAGTATTYDWSTGTTPASGAIVSVPSSTAGTATYTVTGTDANGCSSTAIATVTVNAGPVVQINGMQNGSITVTTNNTVTLTASGAPLYIWSTLQMTNSINHTATANSTISVTGIDLNGCVDSTSIDIIVLDSISIVIPNVFSPNNDHINDFFGISTSGVKELNCKVYNRWGTLVKELNGVSDRWLPDTNVSEGTYFYLLKAIGLDGKDYSREGYLLLVR